MKYLVVIILIFIAALFDKKLIENFQQCTKNNKINTNTLRVPPLNSNWDSKIVKESAKKIKHDNCEKGCLETFISSPFIWIYVEDEVSPRFWKSFYSRRNEQSLPTYIDLCIKSIKKHNLEIANIQLIGKHNLKAFIRECPEIIKSRFVSKNIKLDYIKYYILYHYGGIWMQPSTIAFKDFSRIFNKINEGYVATFDCDRNLIKCGKNNSSDNYQLAVLPKNKIIKELLDLTENEGKIINNDYYFLEKSKHNLITVLTKYKNKVYNFGPKFCGSRDYNGKLITAENFISTNLTILKTPSDILFIRIPKNEINMHPKYSWLERLSKTQLLNSNLWISSLLRNSLKLPDKYFDSKIIEPSTKVDVEVSKNPDINQFVETLKDTNLYFQNPYVLINKESYRNS